MEPVTRNWLAELDVRRGSIPMLEVTGEILIDNPTVIPTLKLAPIQGTVVQNLYVLLEIENFEPANNNLNQVSVAKFSHPANQGQFTQVTIFHNDMALITLDIREIR